MLWTMAFTALTLGLPQEKVASEYRQELGCAQIYRLGIARCVAIKSNKAPNKVRVYVQARVGDLHPYTFGSFLIEKNRG